MSPPRASVALAVVLASACAGAPTRTMPAPPPPAKEGAMLLALPGTASPAFVVANAPSEVVRGRTRFHVADDGTATRSRRLSSHPIDAAIAIPAWLGGGIALLSDRGLALARPTAEGGAIRTVARGAFAGLAIGAGELWTRERKSGSASDWVRVDVAKGTATFEPPPIAAPIAAAWTTSSAAMVPGRVASAGPEFVSDKNALAILDMLGPVRTQDGGATWSPLDEDEVRAAFPKAAPTRIFRETGGLALADDERIVPVSSSGHLGAPSPIARAKEPLPEIAAVRFEEAAPFGVPLGQNLVLVADGPRLAVAALEPNVRMLRAQRVPGAARCDVRKPPATDAAALAIVTCLRRTEGDASSARLDVGTIVDAKALQPVFERSFSYTAQVHVAPSGAVVVAGPCAKTDEVHDFFTTGRACVRDAKGDWRELAIQGVGSFRRGVTPLLSGGLLFARDDSGVTRSGAYELVLVPPDAKTTTALARLPLGPAPLPQARVELAAIDEVAPDRVVIWREGAGLAATTIAIEGGRARIASAPEPFLYDAQTAWGVYGDRAITARLGRARTMGSVAGEVPHETPIVDRLAVSRDGGAHFVEGAWPSGAPVLEANAGAPRLECGAYGCHTFGWARLGWSADVLDADELVSLDDAPEVAAPPSAPPKKSTALVARCTSAGKATPFPPARVPATSPGSYAYSSPRDTLLGQPAPKVSPGQLLQLAPFSRGAVRGGLVAWGPDKGAWGDQAHVFARFSTDLDPLDVVHDTLPSSGLFADRTAFVRSMPEGRASAIALGPGRVLFSTCELSLCSHVFRAVAGAPLEKIDLSAAGEIVRLTNARELGGTLLVVGLSVPREKAAAANDPALFAAVVTSAGTTVTRLGRNPPAEEASLVASADPLRRRLGLQTYSPLPTWTGGTTYVLPIDATGRPASGFEALAAAPSELAKPHEPCTAQGAFWDRGEQNKRRALSLFIDGKLALEAQADVVLRERLSASAAFLDRITLLSPANALQIDLAAKSALRLWTEDDGKKAFRRELVCSVEWRE